MSDNLRPGTSDADFFANFSREYPYSTQSQAREVHRVWRKFRYLGDQKIAQERAEAMERHRQLRARLFGVDDHRDDQSPGFTYPSQRD